MSLFMMKLSVDVLPHSHRSSSAAHVPAMPGIVRRIETSGQAAPAIAFAPLYERCSCAGDAWNSAWTKTPGKLRFPEIPKESPGHPVRAKGYASISFRSFRLLRRFSSCMGLLYLEISSMDCSAPAQSMFFLSWSPTTSIGCFASAFLMELK